jgi:hypothetical protein
MNASVMLELATQEALKGDYVVVSCYSVSHGECLIRELIQSLPEHTVKKNSSNRLKVQLGQGHIQFTTVNNFDEACRGRLGDIFQLDPNVGTWTHISRTLKKKVPSRFERIRAKS